MTKLGKIIGTGIVAIACNCVTSYILLDENQKNLFTSYRLLDEKQQAEVRTKFSVVNRAGLTLSTIPAIIMTLASNILSLSVIEGSIIGAAMTWFGYDDYLDYACPEKGITAKVQDMCGTFVRDWFLQNNQDQVEKKPLKQSLKHEISSYTQKVHSDENFKLAYKVNTICQNSLFNYIWKSSDDSTPELENGNSELLSEAH